VEFIFERSAALQGMHALRRRGELYTAAGGSVNEAKPTGAGVFCMQN